MNLQENSSNSTLDYDPKGLTRDFGAALVLPSDQYETFIVNFPGGNCIPEWSCTGDFFLSCAVYNQGEKIGVAHSNLCHENGYLEVKIDDLLCMHDQVVTGVLVIEVSHSSKVPVELYAAHTHRETGTYVAYPASTFIGDKIYTETHAREMENTLFWPGIINNKTTQTCIAVVNPFKISFSYHLTLFLPDRSSKQTKVLKLAAQNYKIHDLEELFPVLSELSSEEQTQCSICVGGQYKLRSYAIFKDRQTGAFTTMDHMHTYCLY